MVGDMRLSERLHSLVISGRWFCKFDYDRLASGDDPTFRSFSQKAPKIADIEIESIADLKTYRWNG